MNTMMAQLRVYSPNGGLLRGSLPHPLAWEMAVPLNDMPSLTVTYPESGAGFELFTDPCEVAVELGDPDTGTYTEYPGCRFLALRRTGDLQRRPGTVSLTMPSYGWQLRKVRLTNASQLNKEGRREFTNATPGTIIAAMINEAKARGNIPGMDIDFTGSVDSAGAEWPQRFTVDYDFGQDAWSALDALSRQGIVDWQFNGRTLQMYAADTYMRRNLAVDTGIILHPSVSHVEEPADRTLEDLAAVVLVVGDEGRNVLLTSETADMPWGRWEEIFPAGGVKDTSTMNNLGRRVLQQREKPRIEYTRKMVWRPGLPVPFVDYRIGDLVRSRTDTGNQLEPMRVHQITLTQEADPGISVGLVLNDRFMERSLRNERWLNRVAGTGGPGGGGGSGGGTIPRPPDIVGRTPAAPQNLTVTSETYIDDLGNPVGRALAGWDVVTLGEDGAPIDVDRYQLATRRADLPVGLEIGVSVPHPQNLGYISPLDGGYDYIFWVRAIPEFGLPGDWSDPVTIRIGLSDVPPPAPSVPLLSTKLGTVRVEWDGFDSEGEAMPLDFSEIQVEMSSTGEDPWVRIGTIFQPGSSVIATQQPVGAEVWFRFVARNSSHLFGAESEPASIVVQGVTGPDIEANSITANEIAAGTITSEEIAAYSIVVDRLSVGDQSNMIADPLLGDPDLNAHRIEVARTNSGGGLDVNIDSGVAVLVKGTSNSTTVRFVLVNNTIINANFYSNPADNLERPGLATQVTRPGSASGGGSLMGRFRVSVSSGSEAWADGALVTVTGFVVFYTRTGEFLSRLSIVAAVEFASAEERIMQSVSGATIPEGAGFMVCYIACGMAAGVPADVSVSLSQFEVWQEASVYIGDGMISAPKIQADAITTRELSADSITSKHVIRSALYQMASQDSDTTLVITNNANYIGQAGIRWQNIPNIELQPAIFATDPTGTGDWVGNSLVAMGPEVVRNSSGRINMVFTPNVTNSGIYRSWGVSTENQQGIRWDNNNSRFRIMGQLPTGFYTNDLFRGVNIGVPSGNATVWTVSWGAVNNTYIPVCTPAFVGAADTTTAENATCLVTRRNESGMRVVSSRATTRMHILAFTGGATIGI